MRSLHLIDEPPARPPRRFALWELGFRPFYLLASLFAALSIPLWALQFSGLLPQAYLAGPVWHAHEMLFGFALAVIVGFLFTAGRNWTNQPTPSGAALAALAGLWLAARVLVLTPFGWAAAAANVAFPLAAAVALAIPFVKARNRRNYFFVGLLVLMSVAAGIRPPCAARRRPPAGLGRLAARAGRRPVHRVGDGRPGDSHVHEQRRARCVGQPASRSSRRPRWGWCWRLLAADAAGLDGVPLAVVAAMACVAHAIRWALWQPWKTLAVPLVWVLHLAYFWVPVHLALRALAELGVVSSSSATHALTVGAVGGLVIGMMTRTARGHTARPLRADRFDTTCYVLVAAGRRGARCGAAAGAGADARRHSVLRGPVVGRLRPVRRALLARADPAAAGREAGMSLDYAALKLVHQSAVALSVTGFFVRGLASFAGAGWVRSRGGEDLAACRRHRAAPVGADAGLDAAAHARQRALAAGQDRRPGALRRSRRRRPAPRTVAGGSGGGLGGGAGDGRAGSSPWPSPRTRGASWPMLGTLAA